MKLICYNTYLNTIGSKSKIFSPIDINRPDSHNNNHDIEGTRSRMLHVGLIKPQLEEIAGSKPDVYQFKTKREP